MGNRQQQGLLRKKNHKQTPRKPFDNGINKHSVQKKPTDGRINVANNDIPSVTRNEIMFDVFDAEIKVKIVPSVLTKPRHRISSKTVLAVKAILAREGSDDSIIATVIEDRFSIIDDNDTPRLETGTFSLANSRQNSRTSLLREQNQSQRPTEVNNMNLIQQTVFGDDAPIVSATAPSLSPRNSIHGIRRSKLGTRERLVRRRAQLISPHVLPGIVPNERKVLDVIEELDIPHDWGHAFSFPNRKLSSRVVCIDERDDSDVLVTVPAFKSFVSCRDLDVSQSSPRHMRTKITGIGSNNVSDKAFSPMDDDQEKSNDDEIVAKAPKGDNDTRIISSLEDGLAKFQRGSLMMVSKATVDDLTVGRKYIV